MLRGKYGFSDTARFPRGSSPFWKNLHRVWQDSSFHIKWNPGDGSSKKFWSDYWVGDQGPLCHLSFAPLSEQDLQKPISHFLTASGQWNLSLFQHLIPPDQVRQIQQIRLTGSPEQPTCSWNLTPSGDFTVKSAYQIWKPSETLEDPTPWKKLWKLPMAQRVRTFSWLLFKGRLLTNSERCRRKMTNDDTCSICNHGPEDIDHILRLCPLAREVWKRTLPPPLYQKLTLGNITDWLRALLLKNRGDQSWTIGPFITCWKLWEARNHHVFTDRKFKVDDILGQTRAIVTHTLHSHLFISNLLRRAR